MYLLYFIMPSILLDVSRVIRPRTINRSFVTIVMIEKITSYVFTMQLYCSTYNGIKLVLQMQGKFLCCLNYQPYFPYMSIILCINTIDFLETTFALFLQIMLEMSNIASYYNDKVSMQLFSYAPTT